MRIWVSGEMLGEEDELCVKRDVGVSGEGIVNFEWF